eukprot:1481850-Pleurochrysis_carterae.AAC.1
MQPGVHAKSERAASSSRRLKHPCQVRDPVVPSESLSCRPPLRRDVFFAEVFVLYQLCASTRDRLFEVGVGTSFKCKLDVDRYHELALWLQQSFT